MTLPNFLIIGAPRCGTTSLHSYLAQHPQIYLSTLKEPNYFLFEQGRPPSFIGPAGRMINSDSVFLEDDYRELFRGSGGAKAIGEASPKYLSTPGTAERIRSRLPEAKLIAILRNPVERALSDFALRVRDGWETAATLEDAIKEEQQGQRAGWATGLYLHRGFYAQQLDEYFGVFSRAQVRVYLYEDLRDRPAWLFRDIFEFLELDSAFRPDTERHLNASGRIRNPLLRFAWTRSAWAKDMMRPAVPKKMRRTISDFFINQPKERIEFSAEVRRSLHGAYRKDTLALQVMLGRNLSGWLQQTPGLRRPRNNGRVADERRGC